MMQYICRHIVRAPLKSFMGAIVALFFTLSFGILLNTIANINSRIDRLYNETIVYAEIRLEDFWRTRNMAGDIVPIDTLQRVTDLGVIKDMYLMAGHTAFIVTTPQHHRPDATPDILLGVDDLLLLTGDNPGFVGRCEFDAMGIQFANGDATGFAYRGNAAIPIVISAHLAQSHGLEAGHSAYILHYNRPRFRTGEWRTAPAYVLGIHDGEGLPGALQAGAVIPMPAMATLFGDIFGYSAFRFSIDPAHNRELEYITDYITRNLRVTYTHREPLVFDLRDQELRLGVAPLRQHMLLMEMLMPVTTAISVIIGLGFALLFMLQNAKNAAILRVLGMPKLKVQITLWLGQIAVQATGSVAGITIVAITGLRGGLGLVALPYMAGAVIGAAIGAILITSRAPMEMLQVRE